MYTNMTFVEQIKRQFVCQEGEKKKPRKNHREFYRKFRETNHCETNLQSDI